MMQIIIKAERGERVERHKEALNMEVAAIEVNDQRDLKYKILFKSADMRWKESFHLKNLKISTDFDDFLFMFKSKVL